VRYLRSGIYSFLNVVNGKQYLGQGQRVDQRGRSHFWSLRNGKDSHHLQRAFDKYGADAFQLIILEEDVTCSWIRAQ
jgi:group I intron endonuclease